MQREEYTVEGKIHSIVHLLLEQKEVSLVDLFRNATGRREMVVIFIAILELIRLKEIVALQRRHFEDIMIVRNSSHELPDSQAK